MIHHINGSIETYATKQLVASMFIVYYLGSWTLLYLCTSGIVYLDTLCTRECHTKVVLDIKKFSRLVSSNSAELHSNILSCVGRNLLLLLQLYRHTGRNLCMQYHRVRRHQFLKLFHRRSDFHAKQSFLDV